MAVYSCVWLYMAVYGCTWLCMAVSFGWLSLGFGAIVQSWCFLQVLEAFGHSHSLFALVRSASLLAAAAARAAAAAASVF